MAARMPGHCWMTPPAWALTLMGGGKRSVVQWSHTQQGSTCLGGRVLMTRHEQQETRWHGASRMAKETSVKVVYFVRHGQSEDNVAPVFQSPDSPLSAVGRHQAARMAARVATLAFDVLLASPYRRAHETATVMSQ